MYIITKDNLAKALNEAVDLKRETYRKLDFIDETFKGYEHHFDNVKKIIRESKNSSGDELFKYLLEECNCVSKYNDIAPKLNYSPEHELLYDYGIDEDYDDYYEPDAVDYSDAKGEDDEEFYDLYGRYPTPEELEEFIADKPRFDDDDYDNMQIDDMRVDETPKFWAAVNEETEDKKIAKKALTETQVNDMKAKGYKINAFLTEKEMIEYLNNLK